MSSINFHTKQISVKIVYYGPGLCGKTTSLQTIYGSLPEERRPQIVSLATEVDRTIFFDFLPLSAYKIQDFEVRLQLYTVPGQVFYNATRKLVLNGVDGVVFVCDSQRAMKDSNAESLQNLEENLNELGLELDRVPMVMQYNKRDLSDIFSVEEMDKLYNGKGWESFPTVATSGDGLFDALKAISQLVVNDLMKKGLGEQLRARSGDVNLALKSEGDGLSGVSAAVEQAAAAHDAANQAVKAAAPPPAAAQSAPAAAPQIPKPAAPTPSSVPPAPAAVPSAAAKPQATRPMAGTPGFDAGKSPAVPLWPDGESSELGSAISKALAENRWPDSILAVEQHLQYEARRWATSQGRDASEPILPFLFLAGVSSVRYRAFMSALEAVRQQRPVGRSDAMNALIVALEALW